MPELTASHVKMKDKNLVIEKIQNIINGGVEKLQIITDFDRTLSKHHHNGVLSMTSNNIYKLIPTLPREFITGTEQLYTKYRAIEENPQMSLEDKLPFMEDWWRLSFQLFIGLPFNQGDINQAVRDSKIVLRTGTDLAFKNLNKSKIPVLVFSAGLGNVVSTILNEYNLSFDNVKVISNFFQVENEKIVGLQGGLIHVFNKNQHAIEYTTYFQDLKDRINAIVMGDSLGDANMSDGLQGNGYILKIGFLSSHIDEYLPQYLEKFDIVLLDDQTMDLFNALIEKIVSARGLN
ncbi:7-methylguanosine phosphate-specific 5'-nucleotidase-like isoform X2 [Cimex lectularius]|nr:7-methylguanosine phosphate-specific 5'-nucleotidase-like isoform X2 [Cimex lectularius]